MIQSNKLQSSFTYNVDYCRDGDTAPPNVTVAYMQAYGEHPPYSLNMQVGAAPVASKLAEVLKLANIQLTGETPTTWMELAKAAAADKSIRVNVGLNSPDHSYREQDECYPSLSITTPTSVIKITTVASTTSVRRIAGMRVPTVEIENLETFFDVS